MPKEFNRNRPTTGLPYRKVAKIMLFDDNDKLLVGNIDGKLKFPGGGIEDNETMLDGIQRESIEETGITPSSMELIDSLTWDFKTDWAKSDKQKSRYMKYRGEHTHFFIGRVLNKGKPTGSDKWTEIIFYPPLDILKVMKKELNEVEKDHLPYKRMQVLTLLRAIKQYNLKKENNG